MDGLLDFFAGVLLFTGGFLALLFWLVVLFVAVIELYDKWFPPVDEDADV